MGIVRLHDNQQTEIEEFHRALLSCAGLRRRKVVESRDQLPGAVTGGGNDCVVTEQTVCVTGGASFIGLAIVNRLLIHGYSVRLLVSNEAEREKLRETELLGETRGANGDVSVVMAELADVQSLSEAFDGCRGVFHTASSVDPAGLSGYSKSMADVEVKTTECVMEACGRTSSVRNCVLTSSLVACIWPDASRDGLSSIINHDCWSDESVCIDKKLWYALGKLRAEKAAWRIAEERGFKLVTICPGLITGPDFCLRNPTATIAYLKGVGEMYADGLLATVDVNGLAEAQIRMFKEMNEAAFGRYICFDRMIRGEEDAEKLAVEAGMQRNVIPTGISSFRFELSNTKLSRLMSTALRCLDYC